MANSQTGTADRADIVAAEPQLLVSDLARAIDFYIGKLGFRLAFAYGDPPFYGQVVRGGAALNLRVVGRSPDKDPSPAHEPDLLSATLTLVDARPLFEEFQRAGVEFQQPLKREPWGARTFMVRDPDGNLLCFAGGDD